MEQQTNTLFSLRKLTIMLFLIFALNLSLVNYWIFTSRSSLSDIGQITQRIIADPLNKDVKTVVVDTCGEACRAQIDTTIKQATASLTFTNVYDAIKEATQSLTLTSKVRQTTTTQSVPSRVSTAVKEYFVQFGGGTSTASDWTDVGGVASYVDSTQYEGIDKVVFEASVVVPTGNQTAWVRLFNKTDKHPVWFSEMSLSGGQPQLLVSQPIALDQGNKLYQVQIKTQLQYSANLIQARLHITLK